MSGAPSNVSPVWKTCGDPRSSSVNASIETIAAISSVPAPKRRRPDPISQFGDSTAQKSVNFRCW